MFFAGGTEFYYSFKKSCLSHKLFVTLSSVAVSCQKRRHRVKRKLFSVSDLDRMQSKQVKNSDIIVKRNKERFCHSQILEKAL